MKNSKILLSVFMVLVIICVSVAPAFAISKEISQAEISPDLLAEMENTPDNEKIKVFLWYKDIDQEEVDILTAKETGLTPERCAVISEFPSPELLSSLEKGDAKAQKQMNEYLKRTKPARDKERANTEKYAKKHREIANEKYKIKSQSIRRELSLSDSDTVFSSEFAPMIISEMTKEEIESASYSPNVEEISLYYDYEILEPAEKLIYHDSGVYAKESIKLGQVYNVYGLSGDGVGVGLIEANIPGLWTDDTVDFGYDYDDITIVEDENASIIPSIDTIADQHWHSNNTFRVMAHREYGVSPNIDKYATISRLYEDFTHVEAMMKFSSISNKVIDILEVNISIPKPYFSDNTSEVYSPWDKYYDHLVSNHNITVVVAGGNNDEVHQTWVASPGMGNNVITVGGYSNKNNTIDNDDVLSNYAWKNDSEIQYGCEKPDVIMPINFYAGGTSEASPALTATIALMFELKPSLSLYPEAVKAIVLASCHRKVRPSTDGETLESMWQGITERQGAGAPNAWTMVSIICQGTYGIGQLTGDSAKINIIQPPYDAEALNVSIAWIRENGHTVDENTNNFECDDESDISSGPANNLDLEVLSEDSVVRTSSLTHSSTEMCYLVPDAPDFKYQFNIKNYSNSTNIRYGYAWSTDEMRAAPVSQEGIYYIKNFASGRYVTYNENNGNPKAQVNRPLTQAAFNANHQWIIKQSGSQFDLIPGNASTMMYLGQSSTQSGTSLISQLSSIAENINISYNEDGTVSFMNSTNDRILSYSSANLVWNSFNSTTQTPTDQQKWVLEKVNYLRPDVNLDGDIDSTQTDDNLEVVALRRYLSKMEPSTNINKFLADVDGDGIASVLDVTRILEICESQYNY